MNPPHLKPMPEASGTIRISSIIVPERQRTEGNNHDKYIAERLIPSILEHGLITPIVLEDDRTTLRAGRSRMLACQRIGYEEISFSTLPEMSVADKLIVEFEENEVREPMSWQDRVRAIAKIYHLKKATEKAAHREWGYRQAGLLFGQAYGHIRDIVKVAQILDSGHAEIATAANLTEAIKICYSIAEQRLQSAIASRSSAIAGASVIIQPTKVANFTKPHIASTGFALGSDFDPFGELTSSASEPVATEVKSADNFEKLRVPLDKRIFYGDCLRIMHNMQPGIFDAIVCDPPYGNEVEEVEGIDGIDQVREFGTAWKDDALMPNFFKYAYKVLKDNAWMFVFYDLRHEEKLNAWAEEAGFKTQGYPLIWLKTHPCRNKAPERKWTKATEFVMVCRKGNAVKHSTIYTPNWFEADGSTEKRLQNNPYAKPFEFCQWFMTPWFVRGMEIFDPFMGGGSLLRHIARMGGVPFGADIEPRNFIQSIEGLVDLYNTMAPGQVEIVMPDTTQALADLAAKQAQ